MAFDVCFLGLVAWFAVPVVLVIVLLHGRRRMRENRTEWAVTYGMALALLVMWIVLTALSVYLVTHI